ncbi:MAG: ParB N-terminal domain-containing protein [Tetragenococcus koreensis]|nr:ParB N-terminal domain-containing protein [Tetragenococcus koreensis]
MTVEYKVLPVSELNHFLIREIREGIVEDLKERIEEGYNPARPLTVVEKDDGYYVADGNHRLKVLHDLGIEEVTCVIHKEEDPYTLAVKGNADEDTYSPMDLFDWVELISKIRDEGLTQQEIADKIGWSVNKVKQYFVLLNEIVTQVLGKAKSRQKGRVTDEVTNVTFNFTEGWFRSSGLYDLDENYQEKLMDNFIQDKCNWNKGKVKRESAKYKSWMEFIEKAKDKLVDQSDLEEVIGLIESGTFRSESQLLNKIGDFNNQAENKLIQGDSIIEMEKLEDSSIDLVITDPPYGIDYSSNYSKYDDYVTKHTIANDSELTETIGLLDKSLEVLYKKTKENAHVYIFTSWKVYPEFKEVVSKYFDVKNMIVWNKGNASMGDLEGSWGNQHELVIFATKGRRKLNTRKFDIININRVPTTKAIHPTQKPEEVIKVMLEASAHSKDTVIDPFMGSGSTIKAVKEYGNLNYIGIELDRERYEKAVSYISDGD